MTPIPRHVPCCRGLRGRVSKLHDHIQLGLFTLLVVAAGGGALAGQAPEAKGLQHPPRGDPTHDPIHHRVTVSSVYSWAH
jgi:hypothetical protein